jgi:hypothetical protein
MACTWVTFGSRKLSFLLRLVQRKSLVISDFPLLRSDEDVLTANCILLFQGSYCIFLDLKVDPSPIQTHSISPIFLTCHGVILLLTSISLIIHKVIKASVLFIRSVRSWLLFVYPDSGSYSSVLLFCSVRSGKTFHLSIVVLQIFECIYYRNYFLQNLSTTFTV